MKLKLVEFVVIFRYCCGLLPLCAPKVWVCSLLSSLSFSLCACWMVFAPSVSLYLLVSDVFCCMLTN